AALAAGKPAAPPKKGRPPKGPPGPGGPPRRTRTPPFWEPAPGAPPPPTRPPSPPPARTSPRPAAANGTGNFSITPMEHDALAPDRAMAEAQALGFAEADPSTDILGHDAAAKLSILAYRAFGVWIPPDALPVRGIGELTPADCDLAEAMGFRIRLIAQCER